MNCKEIIDNLEAYIKDDLDENEKEVIEKHLKECPECLKEYSQIKNSIDIIQKAYMDIEIPEKLKSLSLAEKSTKSKKTFISIKRAGIAIACVFALLIGIFVIPNSLFTEKVSAGDYRGGFTLTPSSFDSTGVKPDSEFILESQNSIDLSYLMANLSIDNEPAPIISKNGAKSFKIKPAQQLKQNSLYTFRIKSPERDDITWTFQTNTAFRILGAFPGDKTTDVPTNSGIEIYFSYEDFEDIDKYFEISPKAEGRFERHKKAVVFVPKGLKESTLYTVTVKKGLKLTGTSYALSEDFKFQFETTSTTDTGNSIFFTYTQNINEYSTKDNPILPINYYVDSKYSNEPLKVKTSVFSYKDIDAFINAIKSKNLMNSSWAYRSSQKNLAPVKDLDKAFEFEQELNPSPETQQYIKLPRSLPQGFYIVESKWNELSFQTFIQVTDVCMYISNSTNKTLIWLNDLNSKKPISNAKISQVDSSFTTTTDKEGIAYFDSAIKNSDEDTTIYYKIVTEDNKQALLISGSSFYIDESYNMYWNFIQLDRNLYKPNDTVNFWGLVKDRYSNEKIDSLVIEINQGSRYIDRYFSFNPEGKSFIGYYPISEPPLVSQELKTKDGMFNGNFTLPNLDPGGYQLVVKRDDNVVVNSYINIENYTKPAYELNITKDKEAVFPGQKVNFKIKASFFEGTGVPDLDVNYNIDHLTEKSAVTDSTGYIDIGHVSNPTGNDIQGEQSINLYAHSALPEAGEISAYSSVRLFVNDIDVKLTSELKNQKGILNADVKNIVLDRLNNGTAKDDMDYLADPVGGKTLTGTIYKHTWVEIEDGEYYDYVNKVTQKKYRYEERKEAFSQITLTTDSNGKASATFDAPDFKNGYYSAVLNCTDNSGRNMTFSCGFGDYSPYNDYENTRYFLDGGKEKYKTGEEVNLTYKQGTNTLPDGSYLFIKSQNGIRSYETSTTPNYSFILDRKDVPNVYVTGVYFNGLTYVQSEDYNVIFDFTEKNLVIDAKLDKPSYRPGDEVTVKITAKDKDGKPSKAFINTSIVDEALFKLNEQQIETLQTLYTGIPSGIRYSYQSHAKDNNSEFVQIVNFSSVRFNSSAIEYTLDASTFGRPNEKGPVSVGINPRENFKDTAYFNTITLNDNGYGELTFKIPDNITSWRVSLSGVTTDLLAGSNNVKLNVTLPFFINYTLNTTYLVGDKPVLGVTAYGNDLKENEKVFFEVCDSQNQNVLASAEGKAFERVNISLWELTEGKTDIVIRASTQSGLKDSLKHTFSVVKTYHQIEEALYYDLKPGIDFEGGTTGNTTLIFSDKGKGMYLGELTSLMYTSGNRIDQKLTAHKASELISQYFNQIELEDSVPPINASNYQREDGGIAILPYGNSDLDTSAKLSTFLKDQVNAARLKEYFYTKLYEDSPGLKGSALYGLSVLKEPVLLDLDKAAEVKNASVKDLLYIALAYCELGELPKADKIYIEKLASHIKSYKPYYRINTGNDNDDILECTALAAILASKLEKPQKAGFYGYCTSNDTKDITITMERLMYISEEIKKAKDTAASFSYTLNGKTHTESLENGRSFTLTLPSQNLEDLKINTVSGDISMVSMFKKPLNGVKNPDKNLTIEKAYYSVKRNDTKNTFKQNELVKVVLKWNASKQSIDGSYHITDYLPSGLKPIDNPTNMGVDPNSNEISYMESDGQKVTFYVNKDQKEKTLTYYARVISPGTYKAESAIIQSERSKESLNVSDTSTIVIN
jgi:uncharacterized protein YfaS (alpha-2-macroglobulin family)